MSKSQSNQAFNTASSQNATAAGNAQSTFKAAEGDIGDYQKELSDYAASNPFTAGGAYQTAQDQGLASTAAAGSKQAEQALQSAAVRSGMNPAAAIAAGEQASEENTRQQLADVAEANQSRISQDAGYRGNVLQASEVPEQMEASLTGQQLGEQQSALGDETNASKTPSFWQELGQGVINAGSSFAGAYGGSLAKGCWVAARLWGGWNARQVALVRLWFTHELAFRGWALPLLWAYGRWGKALAEKAMPRSRFLTRVLRKVFDLCLVEAIAWTSETDRGRDVLREYDRLRAVHGYIRRNAPVEWLNWAVAQAGEGK